jgi:AhpD family alkylhydroperoxidase
MLATFALSPTAFNSWATLRGSLSKALDVKTRESISLAVSEVNGCDYCLAVHSFAAEHMAKLPADEIILARKGHASDPKRDAAVQFSRKVIDAREGQSRRCESRPRCRLHGCERHGDRRAGGPVLPDELFQ